MIGIRAGISAGVRTSFQAGGVPLTGGGFFLIWGQSNAVGFSDDGKQGSGTSPGLTGSDTRLLRQNLDSNIKFAQDWQAAGSNPLSMISVATEALQPYAAAGTGNNTGIAQGFGRALKRYGITNPHIIVCGVGSTQLPVNWAPSSNYPASGEKLYAHLVAFVNARKAEYGLPLDGIIQVGFESDSEAAGAPNSGPCATVVADMTAFYAQFRSDIGQANCPVWVCMPSDDWGTPANTAAYKTRQMSWAAGDGHARTFDLTPFPIALAKGGNFPHCLAYGYEAFGHCLANEMMRTYWQVGTFDPDQGVTAPHVLWANMGYTAQAGTAPTSAIPMGHVDPKVGDIDILVAEGSPGTHTVSLDTAAGFTSLIAQTDSVLTTSHRSITVWKRVIDQTMLDARTAGADGVKRGPVATPSVSFGAANINVCQIITIRGSSGIGNVTTGANNAGSTSLTIPSGGGAALSTTAANSLLLIIALCNGTTNQIASITNAALTNIAVQRDSQYNAGTSILNFAWATANKAVAGAVGNTVVQFGALSSVNVGAMIELKP
jgi:carbohydrate esterase-like sialic acid-specific acetylesterase